MIRVILGDTLIRDRYDLDEDVVYVGEVEELLRWCLVFADGDNRVIDYADKQDVAAKPMLALAGYYQIMHGGYLRECVEQSIAAGERQLSAVLRRYGQRYPLTIRHAAEWYDFGNIDNLVKARRELVRARTFNSLQVDPILNTIMKVSQNDKKLREELGWYLQLPDELKVLDSAHRQPSGIRGSASDRAGVLRLSDAGGVVRLR